MTPMPHPPYSPDLVPNNFVSLMKKVLKGKHFVDVEEVENQKEKKVEALKGIKTDKFKNCFEQWKSLNRCIASNGAYF